MNRERPKLSGAKRDRIHAVGVGGMGLGPLAIYLARRGWVVSGTDDALSPLMRRQLEQAGVALPTDSGLPDDAELVVISTAVKADHPVCRAAEARGMPIQRRGSVLAEVAREKRLLAVAGSHGKTSVTAMIVSALRAAKFPCSYVVGGLWADATQAPADAGEGEWLVAEVDESDGTIDDFAPAATVLVNVDWDHTDRYPSEANLMATFGGLIARTTDWVLVPAGEDRLRMNPAEGSAQTYTFGATGDFILRHAKGEAGSQTLALGGRFTAAAAVLPALGAFNASNATAALAAVQLLGLDADSALLGTYPGVHRRQAWLHRTSELRVMEDYAHHPAEIEALLSSVREQMVPRNRLVVVFQPHRFSRTRQFGPEFAKVLQGADVVHLLEVYPAGETAGVGGTTAEIAARLRAEAPGLPLYFEAGDREAARRTLTRSTRAGDWVIWVGAGDIEQVARQWLKEHLGTLAVWTGLVAQWTATLSDGTKITRDELLATKTTIRIGGPARVYVEPDTVDDLQQILRDTHAAGVVAYILGRGSNLLVPDAGVDGVVISLRRAGWETFDVLADGRIRVGAGLRLKNLCGLAAKAGLAGFEFLEGIPGNVGGALRMNAGAMGGWMFDVVESVEVLTLTGERHSWARKELHVGYRHCRELEQTIAIAAVLKPQAVGTVDKVGRQIDVYRAKRQESQPREPSAGCIFKNPAEDSAGRLIDACGLKGLREGDAQVSTVHGNFIVNRGGATSAQVVNLMRQVRARVKQATGIELQPEVLLYGARWEDLL